MMRWLSRILFGPPCNIEHVIGDESDERSQQSNEQVTSNQIVEGVVVDDDADSQLIQPSKEANVIYENMSVLSEGVSSTTSEAKVDQIISLISSLTSPSVVSEEDCSTTMKPFRRTLGSNICNFMPAFNEYHDVIVTWWVSGMSFYVIFKKHESIMISTRKQLQVAYEPLHNSMTMKSIKPEMCCCVFVDELWQRAVVNYTFGNQVNVKLVDKGMNVSVPSSLCKPMLKHFCNLPALAIHCKLSDCKEEYLVDYVCSELKIESANGNMCRMKFNRLPKSIEDCLEVQMYNSDNVSYYDRFIAPVKARVECRKEKTKKRIAEKHCPSDDEKAEDDEFCTPSLEEVMPTPKKNFQKQNFRNAANEKIYKHGLFSKNGDLCERRRTYNVEQTSWNSGSFERQSSFNTFSQRPWNTRPTEFSEKSFNRFRAPNPQGQYHNNDIRGRQQNAHFHAKQNYQFQASGPQRGGASYNYNNRSFPPSVGDDRFDKRSKRFDNQEKANDDGMQGMRNYCVNRNRNFDNKNVHHATNPHRRSQTNQNGPRDFGYGFSS